MTGRDPDEVTFGSTSIRLKKSFYKTRFPPTFLSTAIM